MVVVAAMSGLRASSSSSSTAARLQLDLIGGLLPARSARVVLTAVLVPDAAVHMGAHHTLGLAYSKQNRHLDE